MIIGRKNPDFEVYYKKHKELFRGGVDKWKNDRTLLFKEYGWEVLYFDETQVNENDVIQVIG